jgi:predicted membrane chloride channel (bestrophin family)
MQGEVGFVLKMLIVSIALSIAIKQIAPHLHIAASTGGVLASVILPSVTIALLLGWRSQREHQPHS